MAIYAIFDDACACGEAINLDRDGAEYYVVVVKQSFTWDASGQPHPIAPQRVVDQDVYEGDPATSSILLETELAPRKPRVDVLLAGEVVLAQATNHAVMKLEIGDQVGKAARLFGDRVWVPGYAVGLRATDPRPFERMPITWSRSFGGIDAQSPAHCERRNLSGTGFARKESSAVGKRLPNFESPDHLIGSWSDRPPPVGFGPVARSNPSRLRWGGTYDKAWLDEHFPLLPPDFDDRFWNCAPEDQQLDAYRPGERVRLRGMAAEADTWFALPPFDVPVAILGRRGDRAEGFATPDTVLIEPAERRFSVVGRFFHIPRPNVLGIEDVYVGTPWRGWLKAKATRKRYFGRDPRGTR